MNFNIRNYTLVIFFGLLFSHIAVAQFPGCPNINAGPDQNLNCTTNCTTLTSVAFNAGATTDYTVGSIPHTPPISYTEPGGTGVSVGTDDVWSPQIPLPFTFCFYGENYTTCKIGSNGAIKLGTYAQTFHPWSYTASCPSSALTSAGNIFGPYHDIDPSVSGGSVKWYLIGSAPCRIFVVVFNNLAHYSCTSKRSTHMMVLYETTNAIDVYIQKKEICSSWNGGRTIVGIQNNTGSQGMAAPGRNANTNWTVTTPEAWRFNPNGAPIYTVDWLQNGNVIATGNTVEVCPSAPTTYTARAIYTKCDGTIITELDDVTISPSPAAPQLTLANMTPATCNQTNGALEVLGSGGSPGYTYSIGGGAFQASSQFANLPQGQHTITIKDANGCTSSQDFEVTNGAPILLSIGIATQVKCFGDNTGAIPATATGGTGTLNFQLNGGPNATNGNFTGLTAGDYTVKVTDANGCIVSQLVTITQPPALVLTQISVTGTVCNLPNGAIEVSASGGISTYQYSLNNGAFQSTGIFSGLTPGIYILTVKDANDCITSISSEVIGANSLNLNLSSKTDVSCKSFSDGTVIVTQSGGTAPYQFQMNGGPAQSNGEFSNLPAGTYTFNVTDAQSCLATQSVQIDEPELLTATVTPNTFICTGQSINLNGASTGGSGNISYLWNDPASSTTANISVSPTNTTTYNLKLTDNNGCIANTSMTITVLPVPVANFYADVYTGYPGLNVTFTNTSFYAPSYSWDFGNGTSNSNVGSGPQIAVYNETGVFTVLLTATNNVCSDTMTVKINIIPIPDPVIFIPNVFTPNGDGANDLFWINATFINSIKVQIFNRWGEIMAELNDNNARWDGKFHGDPASDGVYFFKYEIVDLRGETHSGHGHVTLER